LQDVGRHTDATERRVADSLRLGIRPGVLDESLLVRAEIDCFAHVLELVFEVGAFLGEQKALQR